MRARRLETDLPDIWCRHRRDTDVREHGIWGCIVRYSNPAAIVSDTSAVGGTVAKAELRNAAGTAKILCSVTATGGGGDITLNSIIISAGQTVSMTSLTYSAPP
jgi:hypothetical protein